MCGGLRPLLGAWCTAALAVDAGGFACVCRGGREMVVLARVLRLRVLAISTVRRPTAPCSVECVSSVLLLADRPVADCSCSCCSCALLRVGRRHADRVAANVCGGGK
jgi:hypothetical protein